MSVFNKLDLIVCKNEKFCGKKSTLRIFRVEDVCVLYYFKVIIEDNLCYL